VATRIGDGVLQIDTLLGGWERVTAGYLVEGPAPVLVETGSQSSVPALLAGGEVDTSIDPVALHHYLSWHAVVPAPLTILRGVRKLPPATVRVYERDGTSTDTRYWDPAYERDVADAGMSFEDWTDATLEAVEGAAREVARL